MARNLWRMFFALSGAGILAGGPLHPVGTMADMLAHPDWFSAHALMLSYRPSGEMLPVWLYCGDGDTLPSSELLF
jgi:hypothetical protein